jgi:hypothetical protein
MTSSNAIADATPVADAPAEQSPETLHDAPATPSPFQLLPVGEAFGVCGLDGECR